MGQAPPNSHRAILIPARFPPFEDHAHLGHNGQLLADGIAKEYLEALFPVAFDGHPLALWRLDEIYRLAAGFAGSHRLLLLHHLRVLPTVETVWPLAWLAWTLIPVPATSLVNFIGAPGWAIGQPTRIPRPLVIAVGFGLCSCARTGNHRLPPSRCPDYSLRFHLSVRRSC